MSVPTVSSILASALAVVNVMGFALFGIDKLKARLGSRRISEKTLLTVATLFGALGSLLGMVLFHHKVSKKKFYLSVPLLLVAQAALLWILQMGL